jgi:two-component system LytT family response regulator
MALVTAPPEERPAPSLAAWAAAAGGLCLVYALIFMWTEDTSPGPAFLIGAANVAPLVALAAFVLGAAPRWMAGRRRMVQGVQHAVLAVGFTLSWYIASRVAAAGAGWLLGEGFHPRPFQGPALAWQIFQGLGFYAAVAALIYARRPGPAPALAGSELRPAATRTLERYLIRAGEAFRPVEVSVIVSITGAQDYSEVATASGRHLVRLSLAEFEARLDPGQFIRVHRSTIIHLAHLERAELAGGGRMLAHMSNGEALQVSRAGVKALRPLIV